MANKRGGSGTATKPASKARSKPKGSSGGAGKSGKGKSGSAKSGAGKSRSGRFLPDRIVAVLQGLGPLVLLAFLVFAGGVGSVDAFVRATAKRGGETVGRLAADRLPIVGIGIVFALLAAFLLWICVQVGKGRRRGFLITGFFAFLSSGFAIYAVRHGAKIEPSAYWQFFLAVFCAARLLGWGPKPG